MTDYLNFFDNESELSFLFNTDAFDDLQGYELFSSELSSDNEFVLDEYDEISLNAETKTTKTRKTSKKSSLKRKQHSMDDSDDSVVTTFQPLKKVKTNFSSTPFAAKEYTEKIMTALNSGDHEVLASTFRDLCTSNASLTKHAYPTIEELRHLEEVEHGSRKNGYLTTTHFPTLPEFVQHIKMVNLMIPDNSWRLSNARCCHDGPTSVFMSSYVFSGTLLCNPANVLSSNFSRYMETGIMQALNYLCSTGRNPCTSIKTEGSLALYVNQEGLITNIEFYETRRSFH